MKLQNSTYVDIFTVILCIAGALFCIFLFQQDLNTTFSRYGETPIGEIIYHNNIAQRRFIDRLIWDRLRKGAPLYNGDLIRTSNMSELILSFDFGDTIEIHSNTIVQIFADQTGIKVDFARGGINVNSSSDNGVVVLSGDKRIAIEPGAVLRAISDTQGALDLSVSEGEAFLEDLFNTGDVTPLSQGSAVRLDSDGQVIDSVFAVPIYPVSGTQFITTQTSAEIPFVWNTNISADDSFVKLEISQDRNFRNTIYSGEIRETNHVHNLPEGIWFWRLNEDQFSRISVIRTTAPQLITPLDGQEISYRNRPPPVRFQWNSVPAAVAYNLEVANNADFLNPVIEVQVRAGTGRIESYLSSALMEGTWYWRVTPVFDRGFVKANDLETESALFSAEWSFTLRSAPDLTAPVLVAPANNAFFNAEAGRQDLLFTWRNNPEAENYTIRISNDSNMTSPVIEHTTTDNFYRYSLTETAITPGTWYWSVYYTGSDGAVSPVSQNRVLNAVYGEAVQRLVFPPENYVISDNFLLDTRFTWRTNLLGNQFQVSQSEDFAELLINEPVNTESFTIRELTKGEYYWRITGTASTAEQTMTSQSRRFVITESLPPPSLGVPDSGLTAQAGNVVIQQGEGVDFSWQPVQDAEYYVFRLYQGDTSGAPVMETIVYDSNISVNMDEFQDGLHTWTVQGLARSSTRNSRRTGLSASQQINVRQLRPVVIQHPRNGFEYAGLDAVRRPDTARWSSPEETINTSYVIARDSRMRDVVSTSPVDSTSFTLPRLNEGTYYWILRAETVEGYDITSQPAQFRVLPIPRLAAPLNRLPQDRHTVTARDIAASRSIGLSWDEVPGANGYIVSVFQGTGRARRTVIESAIINETNYLIEDIRMLGRGTFSWQVEALNVLEDGFIEQRGILQENRLTVDIPAPRQVRQRDSGVLYGL